MENPIQKWIEEDKKLYNLIVEIQSTNKSPVQQAEIAFEKLSELYQIPRMPIDIKEKDTDSNAEQRSLFEEHALIKFLAPANEDPRGLVLSATYHLLNELNVDYLEVAKKEFGNNIPVDCQIGISGEDYNGKVVFPQKENKSWHELGCITLTKVDKKVY